MFQFKELFIPQALEIEMPVHDDIRGSFVKIFEHTVFKTHNIDFELKESYFSFSQKNVIRGMHFQLPPAAHAKIVYCPKGAILDVMVDLRKSSPSFGKYYSAVLSGDNHKAFYIPVGCAHGFKSLEDDSMTVYLVSSVYQKEVDTGILWNSFGLDWACENPILSQRDRSFTPLAEFESPFE